MAYRLSDHGDDLQHLQEYIITVKEDNNDLTEMDLKENLALLRRFVWFWTLLSFT